MNRVKRQEHRYATEMWFLSETEQMSSKSHKTATVTLVSVYNPTESSVTESSNPQWCGPIAVSSPHILSST